MSEEQCELQRIKPGATHQKQNQSEVAYETTGTESGKERTNEERSRETNSSQGCSEEGASLGEYSRAESGYYSVEGCQVQVLGSDCCRILAVRIFCRTLHR